MALQALIMMAIIWLIPVIDSGWSSPSINKGSPLPPTLYSGCRIVFGFVLPQVLFFFGFLSRYHLPCICNSLELGPAILHGICYILAWSLCILHGICYIWPCLPSICMVLSYVGISTSDLHGICYIFVLQTFMRVSWGFFRLSFRVSFKVSFRVSFRASFRVPFRV